ncbi:AI-2E family transporter [Criblamydia sequanensis]|uniref:Conserved putative membrane protein n=1 Tax=Candidatus Criblamydia sequanensis CRIB-18 TaxID=1437425 RepID=A0A090D192_9BACT|nr:AI-2E family transporter [Criblamydia sequanensis]CDR35136.1 Conserved putative membrane protein [Criblamydia sequanensis CRIB-18]
MGSLATFFYSFLTVALVFYTLSVGKDLFIPIFIAIVIWFLLASLAGAIQKVRFYHYKINYPLAITLALFMGGYGLWLTYLLMVENISQVIEAGPFYQERFNHLHEALMTKLNIQKPPALSDLIGSFSVVDIASGVAQMLTTFASNLGVIFLYVIFMLMETGSFDEKLKALIPNKEKRQDVQKLVARITKQIQSYIWIKTIVSIATALISYFVLWAVGVDFAAFWAFIIFILNYIPTIGAIIATILPCMLTLVQFESLTPFLIVTCTLISIHFIIGNIIEPKLIGRSINLSGLVILFSLAVWGHIWGMVGLFLSIPITVITSLILANFPKTRFLSILLSENGEIYEEENNHLSL